ncbi:MAG: hypothetical protein APR55_05375 [Methanolinea sp. SDB]|nr:MAG: hypothetical protein APR55_05375 [Methanolinea sp. SDB]
MEIIGQSVSYGRRLMNRILGPVFFVWISYNTFPGLRAGPMAESKFYGSILCFFNSQAFFLMYTKIITRGRNS